MMRSIGAQFYSDPDSADSLKKTIVILSAAKNLADARGAAETWPSRRRESLRVGQILRAQEGPQDDATYRHLNLLRPSRE